MENELREKRSKGYSAVRSVKDYTMGVLILAAGLYFVLGDKAGFIMDNYDRGFRYMFGSICIVYGGWRIYRGYKKVY